MAQRRLRGFLFGLSIYAVLVRPGYSNQSFENSALRKGPLTDSYIDREREIFSSFHLT